MFKLSSHSLCGSRTELHEPLIIISCLKILFKVFTSRPDFLIRLLKIIIFPDFFKPKILLFNNSSEPEHSKATSTPSLSVKSRIFFTGSSLLLSITLLNPKSVKQPQPPVCRLSIPLLYMSAVSPSGGGGAADFLGPSFLEMPDTMSSIRSSIVAESMAVFIVWALTM